MFCSAKSVYHFSFAFNTKHVVTSNYGPQVIESGLVKMCLLGNIYYSYTSIQLHLLLHVMLHSIQIHVYNITWEKHTKNQSF